MRKYQLRIILMGLDFNSRNLGCSALGYSFLYVLQKAAAELDLQLELVSVNYTSATFTGSNCVLRALPIHLKQKSFRKQFIQEVASADMVFDFTEGDSFTDIYGLKRFFRETALKQYVILKKKPLVLGPQTLGPFNSKIAKRWAKHVVKKSYRVFTRDNLSYRYAQQEFGVEPLLTTDIAFMLPTDPRQNAVQVVDNKVGINISGLMWHGGYTGQNELGISVDYKELMDSYIQYLLQKNWNIWLIPHVLPDEENSPENDYSPMEELKKKYPQIRLAPRFKTPMEAKGFISQMDFFVGSRMHATIGAFSMRVPTVSIAYSRKFQGLYNSVDYPYVIDAKTVNTDQAKELLMKWTEDKDTLKTNIDCSLAIVCDKNSEFIEDIKNILSDVADFGKDYIDER